ncbi:MAG: hypothetical protein CVU89_05205 [Firmicutes bacterium HGW-Firmicutes-14]|jgi:flagellar hook-associated protein 2|nr:MAG: hypothetical protein CVU89_05205 [Firmicutes bacterium HGW-Firmicutes-14]
MQVKTLAGVCPSILDDTGQEEVSTLRLGGIASGLDTEGLVKQLMALERMPLTRLEDKKNVLEWRKSALLDFRNMLLNLQKKASALTLSTSFDLKKSASSDSEVATVTTGATAVNGTYTLEVTSLATATKVSSTGAIGIPDGTYATLTGTAELNSGAGVDADPNAAFSGGTAATRLESEVTAGAFKVNDVTITVDADDTINTVLNKINDSTAGVKAVLSGDRIVLTQKTTGSEATITVGEDTSGFLAAAKLDAAVVVDGTESGEFRNLADTGLGFTSGYFTINDYTFSVDTATESLNDIISKINNSSAGVTAFYDSESDTISITSKTTGSDAITLGKATDTSNFLTVTNISGAVQTLGTSSAFNLNGVDMNRDSNSFEINGITFNLLKAGTTTITVSQDNDKIIKNVEDFVNEYNTVMDWLNTKLTENKVREPLSDFDRKSGILRTDSTLRRVQSYLRSSIFNPVSGLPHNYDQLSDIGITTGMPTDSASAALNSKLQIDKDKLKTAIQNNPDAVAGIFMEATGGIAVKLNDYLNSVTSATGEIMGRAGSSGILSSQIRDMEERIKDFEYRLELKEDRLWRQFSQLETIMSNFQNQSAWLSAQVSSTWGMK